MPDLSLHAHQDAIPVDRERLHAVLMAALPLVIEHPGARASALAGLDEIEVSLVDDAAIAAVHDAFLGDPEPTDVITFAHGEILLSAETAARRAPEFGHGTDRECALYGIHGLLHLHGWEDADPEERAAMTRCQETILARVWPEGSA